MINNKRGQGLSVNAIILIVLAVIVLVMLVLGFTVGWSSVLPFLSTNNVDDVATSCNLACNTASEFDYCSASRDLKTGEETLEGVTCDYLAEEHSQYGIDTCASIICDNVNYVAGNEEEAMDFCQSEEGNVGTLYKWLDEENTLQTYECTA